MHATQAPPPVPHAVACVPVSHDPFAQQPLHEVASQVQAPCTQCCPAAQVPCWHVPPQPSSAPQAFPLQLGVQVEVQDVPLQASPGGHAMQDAPLLPHAVGEVPGWHTVP
jgi:hypothetical protein